MFRLPIILSVGCLAMAGCLTPSTTRSQSEDLLDPSKLEMTTIGDVTAFANTNAIPISGVGLVINLDGRGGPQPAGTYRSMMENELKKRQIPNVREILDSKNHAIVLVSALIPVGARKGDPIDVIVELPPQSNATSLRGGYLTETVMFDYDTAGNLNPQYVASGKEDKLMLGDILAKVEGQLMLPLPGRELRNPDAASEEEASQVAEVTSNAGNVKKAFIWGSGRIARDRPLFLSLNLDQQRARVAMQISEQINQTFQTTTLGGDKLATAKTKEIVTLIVPPQYRLNLPRYMRVIRMIPLQYIAEQNNYRFKLEEQVLEPATTLSAALRLEAMGNTSIPSLKFGLKSGYPLVRFACAEALTYLGQTDGATELSQIAIEHAPLQAYCLTALGSLDEGKCHRELMGLLSEPIPEVRYGAFRALRALDERSEAARGERLNESYWLHRVAPTSASMVHILSGKRPEIVVFGEMPQIKGPFAYVIGPDFTITANADDTKVTISRFSVGRGKATRQCNYDVVDIIRNLAELGGSYNDVYDLLRQAHDCKSLSCQLAIDAMPQAKTVQDLAKLGQTSINLKELPEGAIDPALPETPTVFQQ